MSAEAVSAVLELGFPQCAVGAWAAAPPKLVCRLETLTFLNGYEALATGPTAGDANEFRPTARTGGWRAGRYDPSVWSLHFDTIVVSFPVPRAPGASAIEPPEAPLIDCRGLDGGADDDSLEPRRSPSLVFQRVRGVGSTPGSRRRSLARHDVLRKCWNAVALRGSYGRAWEDASEEEENEDAGASEEDGDAAETGGGRDSGPCNEQAFRVGDGTAASAAGTTRADAEREAVSMATSIAVRVDLCTVLLSASHSQFAELLHVVDMVGVPPPGAPAPAPPAVAIPTGGAPRTSSSGAHGTFTVIGILCDESRVVFHQASPAQLAAAVCIPVDASRRPMSAYATLAAMKRSYAFLISGLCLVVASPDAAPSVALAGSPSSNSAPSLRVWLTAPAVSLLEARHEPGTVTACAHLGRRAAAPPALVLHRIVSTASDEAVPMNKSGLFRGAAAPMGAPGAAGGASSSGRDASSPPGPVIRTDELPMLSIFFCRDELPMRRTEAVIAVGERALPDCCCSWSC